MENMPKKEMIHFNPETGKISLVKTDRTVALALVADGFFTFIEGAAAAPEYAIFSGSDMQTTLSGRQIGATTMHWSLVCDVDISAV